MNKTDAFAQAIQAGFQGRGKPYELVATEENDTFVAVRRMEDGHSYVRGVLFLVVRDTLTYEELGELTLPKAKMDPIVDSWDLSKFFCFICLKLADGDYTYRVDKGDGLEVIMGPKKQLFYLFPKSALKEM